MPRLLLHEEFSRHGEWHLPERPEIRIPGTLTFSPERIELDLNSAFTPVEGDVTVADPVTRYPALHGASTKGELLTLLRATRTSVGLSFGSAGMRQPETVTSSWLVVGAHVDGDECYRALTFLVPGLAAWLRRSPISQSFIHEEGKKSFSEHLLRKSIEPEDTRIDTHSMKIRWGAGTTSKTSIYARVQIDVLGWFEIVPDQAQPLEWFFEQYGRVASMLTILAAILETFTFLVISHPLP